MAQLPDRGARRGAESPPGPDATVDTVRAVPIDLGEAPLCLVGDCHGEAGWVGHVLNRAAEAGCEHVIALGDFGYWDHTRSGITFLDTVDRLAANSGIGLWMIRGNHENHAMLANLRHATPTGPVDLRPHVRWLPDGEVITWAGARLGVAGGAPSIDADSREPGYDWWPEETFDLATLTRLDRAGPLDAVLAHDCPLETPLKYLASWGPGDRHRAVMSGVASLVGCRWWFSGHYHQRVSASIYNPSRHGDRNLRVEVLSLDSSGPRGWLTLQPGVLTHHSDDPAITPTTGVTTPNHLRLTA